MPNMTLTDAAQASKSLMSQGAPTQHSNSITGSIKTAKTGINELTEFVNSINRLMENPAVKPIVERFAQNMGIPMQTDMQAQGTASNYHAPKELYRRPPAIGNPTQDIAERGQNAGVQQPAQNRGVVDAQFRENSAKNDNDTLEKTHKGIITAMQFISGQIGAEKTIEEGVQWWKINEVDVKTVIALQMGLRYDPPQEEGKVQEGEGKPNP